MSRRFLKLSKARSLRIALRVARGEASIASEARRIGANVNTLRSHLRRRGLLKQARTLIETSPPPDDEEPAGEQPQPRPCLKCGKMMLTVRAVRICGPCRHNGLALVTADVDAWGGLYVF